MERAEESRNQETACKGLYLPGSLCAALTYQHQLVYILSSLDLSTSPEFGSLFEAGPKVSLPQDSAPAWEG